MPATKFCDYNDEQINMVPVLMGLTNTFKNIIPQTGKCYAEVAASGVLGKVHLRK